MYIVMVLAGLVGFACWIMTLIKMFGDTADGGVLKGILGIVCPLWAYIWGWMTSGKHNSKNIMFAWTGAWIVQAIAYSMVVGAAVAAIQTGK